MLNGLTNILDEFGYKKIIVNIENLHLYALVQDGNVFVTSILDSTNGYEVTKEQYAHILKQIEDKFIKDFKGVEFLNIFYTKDSHRSREYLESEGSSWILDADNYQLLIFENQKSTFSELKKRIEELLYYQKLGAEYIQEGGRIDDIANITGNIQKKHSYKQYFSLCNTIIILLNVLIFIIVEVTGSSLDTGHMLKFGAMNWELALRWNEYYRLFTYMFLHFGISHLFNNMIVLAFVGENLEKEIGKIKYLIIYFGAGIIAGIVSMGYNMLKGSNAVSAGASGAIFGVVGAMVYVVAINKGRLEKISTRQLLLFVLLSFYGGLTSTGIDNAAHIGGFIAGVLLATLMYRRPKRREG